MTEQITRRPIIGVMGSSTKAWAEYAEPLGRLIAEYDYHLLTGAGAGAMTAVARGFASVEDRKGLVIGIVPTTNYDGSLVAREEFPNPYIDLPILTPLDMKAEKDTNPYSRNYVNVMSSQAMVVLPGDHGTRNEFSLGLQFHKDMVMFGPREAFAAFPEQSTRVSEIESVREFLDGVTSKIRETKQKAAF